MKLKVLQFNSGLLLYRRDKFVSSPSLHQISNVDYYCSRDWSCRDELLFSIDYLYNEQKKWLINIYEISLNDKEMESKVGLCLYAISPFSPSLFYQQITHLSPT